MSIAKLNLLPQGDVKRAAEARDLAVDACADEPLLKSQALLMRANLQKTAAKRLADLEEAVRWRPTIPPRSAAAAHSAPTTTNCNWRWTT